VVPRTRTARRPGRWRAIPTCAAHGRAARLRLLHGFTEEHVKQSLNNSLLLPQPPRFTRLPACRIRYGRAARPFPPARRGRHGVADGDGASAMSIAFVAATRPHHTGGGASNCALVEMLSIAPARLLAATARTSRGRVASATK
jgi:hypothetical protein